MSDELNPDGTPPGFSEQSSPNGADLDRMLAEAADLAAEVSAEVGTLPVRSDSGHIPIDSLEPDGTDIEEKLNELDQILDRTASEVGAAAPKPNPDDSTPGTIDVLAVPDFMSEFMDVEQPAPPPSSTMPTAAPSSPAAPFPPTHTVPNPTGPGIAVPAAIPDFMSEFTQPDANAPASGQTNPHALTPPNASRNPPKLGVVGSPVKPIEVEDEPPKVGVQVASPMAPPKPVVPVAELAAPPVVSTGGPAVVIQSVPAAPVQKAGMTIDADGNESPGKSGGVALPFAALLVSVMETIDRPIARLGPGPRKLIGLFALLMFAASFVVLAASLL